MPRISVISIFVSFLVGFYCYDNYDDYIDYIKVRIISLLFDVGDIFLSLTKLRSLFRTMLTILINLPGDSLSMVLLNLLQPCRPPYKIPSLKRRTLVRLMIPAAM